MICSAHIAQIALRNKGSRNKTGGTKYLNFCITGKLVRCCSCINPDTVNMYLLTHITRNNTGDITRFLPGHHIGF